MKTRLNTYLITSDTNYGLMVHVINAATEAKALEIARANGAWDDCRATKIPRSKRGMVASEGPFGG